MLEMVILDDAISYTFMCRNRRFMVDVSAESLGQAAELVEKLFHFKDTIDDPDIYVEFEGRVIDAVDEHVLGMVSIARSRSSSASTPWPSSKA